MKECFLPVEDNPEEFHIAGQHERERPDIILNMHTGAGFIQPLRPFIEPGLLPAWEQYYRHVRGHLADMGLQHSSDPAIAGDSSKESLNRYNLDSALNFHSGALAFVVESAAHSFSRSKRDDKPFRHSLDQLMDAQLTAHEQAMQHLLETGGVSRWMNVKR